MRQLSTIACAALLILGGVGGGCQHDDGRHAVIYDRDSYADRAPYAYYDSRYPWRHGFYDRGHLYRADPRDFRDNGRSGRNDHRNWRDDGPVRRDDDRGERGNSRNLNDSRSPRQSRDSQPNERMFEGHGRYVPNDRR